MDVQLQIWSWEGNRDNEHVEPRSKSHKWRGIVPPSAASLPQFDGDEEERPHHN